MCCPAGASRGKPGDSQKTYSRTSKIVGYFELSVPLSDHLLHKVKNEIFEAEHRWNQPTMDLEQAFRHPTFDTQKVTKIGKMM